MRPLSLLLPCLAVLLSYVAMGEASGPIISCCLKTSSTRVRLQLLQSYRLQNSAMCQGLSAVSFITMKGVTICSDPSTPWARKAISFLQKKHKSQSPNQVSMPHDPTKLGPTKLDSH
ncbi:C-C motif chemokine 8 [Sardina pilchardus]|uniref:C-C motif chemokine 8 n=1 Tax=Sardina pilchardus TaxID=27697 RepID=UPI002E0F274C